MSIGYPQTIVAGDLSRLERLTWTVTRALGLVAFAIALLFGIALLGRPVMASPADVRGNDSVDLLGDGYAEMPVAFGRADRGARIGQQPRHVIVAER